MKEITINTGLYAAHWGLTDLYEESAAALKAALDSGEDFETEWFGAKKEINYAQVSREDGKITVRVSSHCDDLWDSDDLIYDALWHVSKIEEELPEEIIDSIRDAAIDDGIDDSCTIEKDLPADATFDDVVKTMGQLEDETMQDNHESFERLCDIVKAHVQYMNTELMED